MSDDRTAFGIDWINNIEIGIDVLGYMYFVANRSFNIGSVEVPQEERVYPKGQISNYLGEETRYLFTVGTKEGDTLYIDQDEMMFLLSNLKHVK